DATKEYYRIVRVFGRRGLKYFPSNVPSTLDVYDVNGASAAPINVYADFVRSIDPRAITKEKYFWDFTNPRLANRPILDFLNVKYVIADTTLPFDNEPLYQKNQFRIYENPGYLSRFFLTYEAQSYNEIEKAQTMLADRKFDSESVLIPENQFRTGFLNGTGTGSVKVLNYSPDEIDLEVLSDKNAVLVSSEVYYPGWRVLISGQPAEMLLINTAFRGVYLPAGKHHVIFQFNSAAFKNGTMISLLSLGAVLILAYFKSRQNGNVVK
ncbi:MAG TPA: YfhO family protein, partial [Acidobacteriota bacterium]|nr:YfhO family protein [Acidobacteriota bacterium]